MGCDIHAHTEIKINGVWHHFSQPRIQRDYDLFAKMANVRNYSEITPVAEPRGLPADATFTTRLCSDHDGTDGHSHSWLSGKELAGVVRWWDQAHRAEGFKSLEHQHIGYLFGNGWDLADHENLPLGYEDVRIVFWFDN